MKYKYVSPYKSNFMVGIIDLPLLIIIYIIISFTRFGESGTDYYYDNIIDLFKNRGSLEDAICIILLITLPFVYGILLLLTNKIIYNFTIYHIYIPSLLENFIIYMIKGFGAINFKRFFLN